MTRHQHILGVILAGGQSRRYGATDKGLADLSGRPVLANIIDAFAPQVGQLILNANGDPARFASIGLDVLADDMFAAQGPLSGILAGLQFAAQHGFAAMATASSDVPFLPPDLISRLEAERCEGLAIALSQGRRHPTIAIWPLAAQAAVTEALASGALGVDKLAAKLGAVAVAFPLRDIGGVEVDPFFNLNTPQDFATARSLISQTRKT